MFGLTRSSSDTVVFGVCGGLSQRLGISSSLVRLVFVILGLASGVGIALYLLLALLLPLEGYEGAKNPLEQLQRNFEELVATFPARRQGLGIALILVGVIVLLMQLGLFEWLTWARVWPLLLIFVGVALFWRPESPRR